MKTFKQFITEAKESKIYRILGRDAKNQYASVSDVEAYSEEHAKERWQKANKGHTFNKFGKTPKNAIPHIPLPSTRAKWNKESKLKESVHASRDGTSWHTRHPKIPNHHKGHTTSSEDKLADAHSAELKSRGLSGTQGPYSKDYDGKKHIEKTYLDNGKELHSYLHNHDGSITHHLV